MSHTNHTYGGYMFTWYYLCVLVVSLRLCLTKKTNNNSTKTVCGARHEYVCSIIWEKRLAQSIILSVCMCVRARSNVCELMNDLSEYSIHCFSDWAILFHYCIVEFLLLSVCVWVCMPHSYWLVHFYLFVLFCFVFDILLSFNWEHLVLMLIFAFMLLFCCCFFAQFSV